MAGEKVVGSSNPTAIRIRDNQRRSRARHKEYVDGLQKKVQDYERRGVEATMEMQQAARNVAVENSRLRQLLGYHGVSKEDVDTFLQSFPDQTTVEASKATIGQSAASQQPSLVAINSSPKVALPSLPQPPSTDASRADFGVPQPSVESSTREAVDAAVGINRDSRNPRPLNSVLPQRPIPAEPRQTLRQPQHHPPLHPVLPPLVLEPMRRDSNSIDKLSMLATASVQQESQGFVPQLAVDKLPVVSPPAGTRSPTLSSRLTSTSPRSQEANINSRQDEETKAPSGIVPGVLPVPKTGTRPFPSILR